MVTTTEECERNGCLWGPLERSRLAGTVHRKCQRDGCTMVNALDNEEEEAG